MRVILMLLTVLVLLIPGGGMAELGGRKGGDAGAAR